MSATTSTSLTQQLHALAVKVTERQEAPGLDADRDVADAVEAYGRALGTAPLGTLLVHQLALLWATLKNWRT